VICLILSDLQISCAKFKKNQVNQEHLLETFLKPNGKDETFFYCDIDDFHSFNLKYSFEKGNFILKRISEIFEYSLFIKDWLKIDNDEFLAKCEGNFDQNKNSIFHLSEEINKKLKVSVSIGVSDMNINNAELNFKHLKSNLYLAKKNGKNKICYI
jgi:GGDEF domain-containing protein